MQNFCIQKYSYRYWRSEINNKMLPTMLIGGNIIQIQDVKFEFMRQQLKNKSRDDLNFLMKNKVLDHFRFRYDGEIILYVTLIFFSLENN